MKKIIIGAIASAILSSIVTGVAVNTLTTQNIKENNVIYSKEYAHKNIVDMTKVRDIQDSDKGVLIGTETDGYYWER